MFPYLSLSIPTTEFCLRVSKKNPVGFIKSKWNFTVTALEGPQDSVIYHRLCDYERIIQNKIH